MNLRYPLFSQLVFSGKSNSSAQIRMISTHGATVDSAIKQSQLIEFPGQVAFV